MVVVPERDEYLENLLLGIKDGIRDSVICDEGGRDVNIPDDYSTGYEIGCLILEIYKHVQSLPQANIEKD